MKAKSVLALLFSPVLLFLTACGSQTTGLSSESDSDISFMLDWTANTNHVGLFVAQKLGYYKDAGLSVALLPTSQTGVETAIETGVADVGFTTLSNVAAVNARGSQLHFVFDLTQKPVARWCSLASRTDITSPKDFSGKTFVSFGSAEHTAVVQQMIATAGGKPDFETVTVGTSTFQTLTSGKGDFGGFYSTWEGVESQLRGPALTCFTASDWGVPGNPDQLGFAVKTSWEANNSTKLQKFINATARGYAYALAHSDEAAQILVEEAADASLDPVLTKASMNAIVKENYWGNSATIAQSATEKTSTTSGFAGLGVTDMAQAQSYLDFLWKKDVYTQATDEPNNSSDSGPSSHSNTAPTVSAPQATQLASNAYVKKSTK